MNANELMVDDWVLHDGEPYQIRQLGIYGMNRDGEDYPAVCVGKPKGIGLIIERNEIEPIPLTPEILKKNFSSTTDWYFIGTDKFCFRIDKHKDKWDLYFGRDGRGTNLQIKISYVHELQHALKLCGINKETEL